MKKRLFIGLVMLAALFFSGAARARVTGLCSNCHTMHNSQGGSAVVSGGPYKALTKGDCVGCHTGTNNGTNSVPYVLDTSAPSYNFPRQSGDNTLAGGNFYWVKNGGDSKGHNVSGIAGADGTLGQTPPGFNTSYTANGNIGTSWSSNQLTCAGTYGCHGKHDTTDQYVAIAGAHHTVDTTIDGSTVGKSFRFLYGIKGTEDSDWEYSVSTTDHNGYYASDYQTTGTMDSASINYLCAECHGNFHLNSQVDGSTAGSPWLRHPTDFDMNNVSSKEYGNYPNSSVFTNYNTHDYFPDVPVGNTSGAVKSTVLSASGDAIVLCLSCHRAHGSPYDSILRWDYKAWPGSGTSGCVACHTSKD